MSALEDKMVEYIPRLRRYARALLNNDAIAADDLVQDTLERALSKLHYWRRGSDLRAWLFTIMHNIYANQVRRAVNGPQFVDLSECGEPAESKHTVESSATLQDICQALAQLPMEQREVLLLVTLEGLPYRQVAKIMKIPDGTVMSRLSRARAQLRQLMSMNDKKKETNKPDLRRVK